MDRSNWFIEGKALFGCFPVQESVQELEGLGVRHFLDLTREGESKITPYITNYNYEKYEIEDHSHPTDRISFARLIVKYADIIENLPDGEFVYIHCRGGHGRSGLVAACLLAFIYQINPREAMGWTSFFHSQRKVMAEKWRRIGAPQTRIQKNFVLNFFKPFCIRRIFSSSTPGEQKLVDAIEEVDWTLDDDRAYDSLSIKLQDRPNLVKELLSTGLGKLILVTAAMEERERISQILGRVRDRHLRLL